MTILPEHQLKVTGLNHQARAGYATPFSNSLEKQSVREENQTNTKQNVSTLGTSQLQDLFTPPTRKASEAISGWEKLLLLHNPAKH